MTAQEIPISELLEKGAVGAVLLDFAAKARVTPMAEKDQYWSPKRRRLFFDYSTWLGNDGEPAVTVIGQDGSRTGFRNRNSPGMFSKSPADSLEEIFNALTAPGARIEVQPKNASPFYLGYSGNGGFQRVK